MLLAYQFETTRRILSSSTSGFSRKLTPDAGSGSIVPYSGPKRHGGAENPSKSTNPIPMHPQSPAKRPRKPQGHNPKSHHQAKTGAFTSAMVRLLSRATDDFNRLVFETDRHTQRIDRQAHLGHSQGIGIDFGVAAKSLSERRRKFQWIETRKRIRLKRGGASD